MRPCLKIKLKIFSSNVRLSNNLNENIEHGSSIDKYIIKYSHIAIQYRIISLLLPCYSSSTHPAAVYLTTPESSGLS